MNKQMHISNGNKRILQIAVPSIISNITVPLLGLVDVTIVGHLGSAAYIGAIAVGGMLFNIIYWIFGFLRMGTSGMTSQAFGQRNKTASTFSRRGIVYRTLSDDSAISHPKSRICFHTDFRRSRTSGHSLLSYLHLGGSCHARPLRFCRLVHRNAEFPFSDVYRYYAEYCEYPGKSLFCIPFRNESRRSSSRNAYSSICRFPDGSAFMATLL